MNRLNEIKEEEAKKRGFGSWKDLSISSWLVDDIEMADIYNEVIKKYAIECMKNALDNAGINTIHLLETYNAEYSEIKLEITDSKNIILI